MSVGNLRLLPGDCPVAALPHGRHLCAPAVRPCCCAALPAYSFLPFFRPGDRQNDFSPDSQRMRLMIRGTNTMAPITRKMASSCQPTVTMGRQASWVSNTTAIATNP